jgi:hypothetical protein
MKVIDWVKKNKLATVLLLVIGLLVVLVNQSAASFNEYLSRSASVSKLSSETTSYLSNSALPSVDMVSMEETTSFPDNSWRLVATQAILSLVVDEVESKTEAIINKAEELGGFMVSRSINQPEEAPYAYLSFRIPSDKLEEINSYSKSLAVKVVSEEVNASDITDQYEDIEEKLALLEENKSRFETIMAKATEVEDILQVQREILSLQEQIDYLRGRQEYLDQSVQLSLVSIYLSTDELALPYQPTATFRPQVIFKQAVRSVISNLRNLAAGLIWLFTYAVFWLPVVIGVVIFRRLRKKK